MRLNRRRMMGSAVGAALLAAGGRLEAAEEPATFADEWTDAAVLLKSPAGKPILRYLVERVPEGEQAPSVGGACFTHPIYTPAGVTVSEMAPADHPHHRGVFCGWVRVEGEQSGDWWGWGAKAPKDERLILSREARATEQSSERVTLRLINSWRAGEVTVLRERLTLSVFAASNCHVLDYEYKFTVPTRKTVTIAENPFGGFCYRARPRGKQEITGPDGPVQHPDAVFDKPDTNWPVSLWYDLTYRAADGTANGVAVMDHPSNPVSTWHVVRGLHMLNPCIVAAGPHSIDFGEPLYLQYRLVVHDGDAASVDLGNLYKQFVGDE